MFDDAIAFLETPTPMNNRASQVLLASLIVSSAVMLVVLTQLEGWRHFWSFMTTWNLGVESVYHRWFKTQTIANSLLLLPLAYLGGILASISPCILSLLPINLSYIGTREFHSYKDAIVKSLSFVLGVVTVLSCLGLFSSLATSLMLSYRGYINVAIGLLIVVMGLSVLEVVHLPLPQIKLSPRSTTTKAVGNTLPVQIAIPYGVGLTFALLSSPCASPVLFAFLAAAATTGSPLHSWLTMVCYAIGYTTIIFLSSLFTGLVKQSKGLLPHTQRISRGSSLMLLVLGGYYLLTGLSWIWRTPTASL
jgi:cytochrome c-type biogenesis protein